MTEDMGISGRRTDGHTRACERGGNSKPGVWSLVTCCLTLGSAWGSGGKDCHSKVSPPHGVLNQSLPEELVGRRDDNMAWVLPASESWTVAWAAAPGGSSQPA